MSRPRLDTGAVVAAALVLVMMVVYLSRMPHESDEPVAWFLAALVLGAAAAGYGAYTASPRRGAALLLAGFVLGPVGMLAILSIGLPILVAGALCLRAAARSTRLGSATAD